MPEPLSTLERDVLDYLIEYVRDHTYQPSVREIGSRFGIKSTKTVSELLQSLAGKGWIERDPARSRGVRLLGLDLRAEVVSVPHVDVHLEAAAFGDPMDNLTLDRRLVGSSPCFMISMVGDTMRDSGIWDGDLLVIEPVGADRLEDGDLVVARQDEQTLVRRLLRRDGQTLLDSGRTDMAPSPMTSRAGAEVLGRVVAVVRRLRTDAPAGLAPEQRTSEGVIPT